MTHTEHTTMMRRTRAKVVALGSDRMPSSDHIANLERIHAPALLPTRDATPPTTRSSSGPQVRRRPRPACAKLVWNFQESAARREERTNARCRAPLLAALIGKIECRIALGRERLEPAELGVAGRPFDPAAAPQLDVVGGVGVHLLGQEQLAARSLHEDAPGAENDALAGGYLAALGIDHAVIENHRAVAVVAVGEGVVGVALLESDAVLGACCNSRDRPEVETQSRSRAKRQKALAPVPPPPSPIPDRSHPHPRRGCHFFATSFSRARTILQVDAAHPFCYVEGMAAKGVSVCSTAGFSSPSWRD